MKIKSTLTAVIVTMSLLLLSQAATAATNASILYSETEIENGYWKYDYTFANLSTNSEYLFGVQFYFDNQYDIGNTQSGGSWDILSTTSFLGTHSSSHANDITAGDSLSGFSFTINNQIGDISYAAFFDDHSGNRSYNTGTTSLNLIETANPAVAPEPVSTVLFLTGGATMAFRYRLRRKKKISL